jgi:Tol biopolymer transport system component
MVFLLSQQEEFNFMIKHIFMKGGRPFAGLIIFFTIISFCSCHKENDEIGEIYYGNLTGKMSFRQYSSPGNDKIIIVDFDKKSTTILIPKDNARIWDVAVSIAPGGQEVVYSACNLIKGCYQLFLMSVDSGNYIQLTKPDLDLGSPNYPTWNINGTKIFYVRAGAVIGGPVYSILPDGDSNMIVANLDVHSRVCISRDEDYLLMGLKGYPDYESGGIYRYNIHSHALKQLAVAENTSYAFGPVYSPDEQKIPVI